MKIEREVMIEQLATEMVNGMGWQELASFAYDAMKSDYGSLSNEELLLVVKNCAPHLLNDDDDTIDGILD